MIYKFKRIPYKHQKDALRNLTSRPWGGALLMEPRTGKTKVAIDYACALYEAGKITRVLISCPVAVMGVWEDELANNVPDRIRYRVTIWDKKGRRRTALPRWNPKILDFVIINHDAFSAPGEVYSFTRFYKGQPYHFKRGRDREFHLMNPDPEMTALDTIRMMQAKQEDIVRSKTRGGRFEMKKAFALWQPDLICLDESHRFKTVSASKTRTMRSMVWNRTTGEARIPYRVIMTGTPVTKKKRVFDIYSQWRILNPSRFKGMTMDEFKHHYGRWIDKGNYEMWVGNRPVEIEKLRAQIHMDSFSVTRDECFDLPKMSHQVIPIELEGETARVYDEMAEEMVAKLKSGEITEATIKLVQAMRLSQISSGVARTPNSKEHPKGQLIRIGWEKIATLESILSDLFEADEKVVVAARFSHDIAAVVDICKRLKVPEFTLQGRRKGVGQSRTARHESLGRFRTMQGPACYAVQPASGSMGIDLSSASTLIWFSLTNSWVDYTQMNDRIALNPHAVSVMFLLASPVDHVLYESLQEDGDIARAITESPERLLRNYKAS